MNQEILNIIRSKRILLEKEIFDLLQGFDDAEVAKTFLENLEKVADKKIINTTTLTRNFEFVQSLVNNLPHEAKESVDKVFVKLGISLEVRKETEVRKRAGMSMENRNDYRIFYSDTKNDKKITLADFVGHFRSRYQELQRILMHRADLQNFVSINKISGSRQKVSIIGMVAEKRTTANNNLMITFEDLTGKIKVLVKKDSECYKDAQELQLDDVVAVQASGSREILFAFEIVYPDSFKEKVKFNEDYNIAFVSDIHAGSKKHLGKEFRRFIEWLKSDDETAQNIRYLFIVGDNVDGVGVFPGQENLLELTSLKDQYSLLASYLKEVPERVTMFMCPGQHDSVRVAEPQPVIDNHYGEELYSIPNLVLVSNPATIKLVEGDKEFKVLMYHGASVHAFINEIEELRLLKAHRCPAKAIKHMLKRRHLAPMHGVSTSVVYVPNVNKDPLVISEVPDVFCTGEVHRLDIENYKGTVIITGSCWQAQTDFEEKVGNVPDPCKVPVFNVRTRELKIFDFSSDEANGENETGENKISEDKNVEIVEVKR